MIFGHSQAQLLDTTVKVSRGSSDTAGTPMDKNEVDWHTRRYNCESNKHGLKVNIMKDILCITPFVFKH